MDYSMFLKRKRNQVLTTAYTNNASANNPIFNRDKKTRGFDNGVLTVLFERGLIVGNRNGGNSGGVDFLVTFTATTNGDNIELGNYVSPVVPATDRVAYFLTAGDYASNNDGSFPNDYSLERPIEITLTASTGFRFDGPVTEIFIFTGNKSSDEVEYARYTTYGTLASVEFFAYPIDNGSVRYRQL